MKTRLLCLYSVSLIIAVIGLDAQVVLNPIPQRVIGHAQLSLSTASPNLVEGRELNFPQGLAVEPGGALYVSDTSNNRVLAWRNASAFANGAPADLVVGQKDMLSTLAQGPGTTFSAGLNSPTGLAVRDGNLYVVDSGNNRILRFPAPFSFFDQQQPALPDLVIGQPNFNSKAANQNNAVPSESTISLSTSAAIFRSYLAFDSGGNLYVSDAGNHRVLRYKSSDLTAGNNGPTANLVLGQASFGVPTVPAATAQNSLSIRDLIDVPAGLAFDSAGRLFVADSDSARPNSFSRVLVFVPPFSSGMLASRVMGVYVQVQGQPAPAPDDVNVGRTTMLDPEGIFMAGGGPGIVDALSNRILLFDPFDQWPAETATNPSPMARAVIGQGGSVSSRKANRGQAEPWADTLSTPTAAVFVNGELFVTDTGNHRVLALPQQGNSFGPASRVLGQDQFNFNTVDLIEGREFQFAVPLGRSQISADAAMVVDQASEPPHLYVADTYNNRILGFYDARNAVPGVRADLVIGQPDLYRSVCNYDVSNPNGSRSDSPTASSLCRPVGLALDENGNLWVADSGNGRVLRFPAPFAAQASMPQADIVLGQPNFTTRITDPTAGTMAAPYGIAYSPDNGLLVSDVSHNRVLLFPKAGGTFTNGMQASKVIGQPDFSTIDSGADDNRLSSPHHIALDSDGRVYVADTGNNRLQVFDQIARIANANARRALSLKFTSPRGVFVSQATGEIWVTDSSGAGKSLRLPKYFDLLFGITPTATVPASITPLALTQDQYGNLYVADSSNRLAIYYPGVDIRNAANRLPYRALAPGSVAALFPLGNQQFNVGTQSWTDLPNPLPLPTEMADVQVLFNGRPAPLYSVSPTEVDFVVPMDAPGSGTADIQVVQKSNGQILGAGLISMDIASPAIYTVNGGIGQAKATNEDGTDNSGTNPAARGSVITLLCTGQGFAGGAPNDGDVPQDAVPTDEMPRVAIGLAWVDDANVLFSGLSQQYPGMWRIDVRIPSTVAPGGSVPIILQYKGIFSTELSGKTPTIATIAVK